MKQSLQRTRKMMAEQLARVAQVSEVMGEQDALLMNTFAEHQVRSLSRISTAAFSWCVMFFTLSTSASLLMGLSPFFFVLPLHTTVCTIHRRLSRVGAKCGIYSRTEFSRSLQADPNTQSSIPTDGRVSFF